MKTRIITAIVGIIVLIGVMFTFDTMIFNLVIAAITLIAIHEIYNALGFEKKDWLMYAAMVPYTLLVMFSNYSVMRRLVMPVSFVLVTFYAIYLVVRNGTISYQKASGLLVFSGIVIFCFYSFILLKERLPVEQYGYDAMFFILLILCFAWGGDTCAYFAGRAFGSISCARWSAPKRPWRVPLAACWAPWCSVWSQRWFTRWRPTAWRSSPAPTSAFRCMSSLRCWAVWRRCWASMVTCLPAWSSASAESRITAPSFRGTAASLTALTV